MGLFCVGIKNRPAVIKWQSGFCYLLISVLFCNFAVHLRPAVTENTPAQPHLTYCVQIKCVQQNRFFVPSCFLNQCAGLVRNKRRTVEGQAGGTGAGLRRLG